MESNNITEYISSNIKIEKIKVRIDNKPTEIDERSSSVLKYRTPHFKASAIIKFPPLKQNQIWKVGWIQACTYMQFHNTYGSYGYSSWKLPALSSGEIPMISDSDGKNFPWYGSKSEVALIKGPQAHYTPHYISMNDNFYPHVTWDIPTSHHHTPKLTNVKRNQKFLTWLVAMDVVNRSFIVLRTYKWKMQVEISVNPLNEIGKRARLVSEPLPKQPKLLKHNIEIPNCALYPANANSTQILVWHPRFSKPFIIVSQKCFNLR